MLIYSSWQQRLVFSEIERGTNNWEPAAGEVLHLVQSHVSVKLHAAHRHQPEQQVLQRPGQENKDTKKEETDHEGNSRSSISQIIKWTFQVGLKTTSIRWRSWSSVWKTSAACVRSRASRSLSGQSSKRVRRIVTIMRRRECQSQIWGCKGDIKGWWPENIIK